MRNVNRLCLLVVVSLASATAARATIGYRFAAVPITPQAIASDPALATMQCWELLAITDGDWASAGVRMTLPPGVNFYNHLLGGNTFPNPLPIVVPAALAFDTYVTGPGDTGIGGAPAILGGFPEHQPFSLSGNLISVSWGDLTPDAPGTYPIMRFTWPQGFLPDVLDGAPNNSRTSQVNPESTVFIAIPEPATLGLTATSVMLMTTRAPRRGRR